MVSFTYTSPSTLSFIRICVFPYLCRLVEHKLLLTVNKKTKHKKKTSKIIQVHRDRILYLIKYTFVLRTSRKHEPYIGISLSFSRKVINRKRQSSMGRKKMKSKTGASTQTDLLHYKHSKERHSRTYDAKQVYSERA